ncbi:MAG: four helix bundle protein, partial [Bacteroidota bacterium]
FVHKLSVGLKELKETEYWLTILDRSGYLPPEMYKEINDLLIQVRKMLISSIKTKKAKMERKKQ